MLKRPGSRVRRFYRPVQSFLLPKASHAMAVATDMRKKISTTLTSQTRHVYTRPAHLSTCNRALGSKIFHRSIFHEKFAGYAFPLSKNPDSGRGDRRVASTNEVTIPHYHCRTSQWRRPNTAPKSGKRSTYIKILPPTTSENGRTGPLR